MDAYNQMNAAAQKGSISSDDFDIHLQQLSARYNISILVLDEDSETIRVSGGDPAILKIELWNHVLFDSAEGSEKLYPDTPEPKSGPGGGKASKYEENIITNKTLVRNDSPFYIVQLVTSNRVSMEYLDMWGFLDNGNLFFIRTALEGIRDHRWHDSVSLCTDDVHAGVIYREGHLNRVVQKAIGYGAHPLDAIRYASYNAAREYGFDDLGAIAPGYVADMQLVDALDGRQPSHVFCRGKLVAEEGRYLGSPYDGGLKFTNTMKLPYLSGPGDFRLKAPASQGETLVIYSKYDGPFNKAFYETLPVEDGYICIRQDPNLAMACVCNRHGLNQRTVVPIRNFGITEGAIATTVSHDCHNLTMIYRDPEDAWIAAETLKRSGGGIAVVLNGKVLASLALPAAGLMSQLSVDSLAPQVEQVEKAVYDLCAEKSSLLKMSTFALAALPGAIMTDKGVLDGQSQTFMPVFR